MPQAQRRRVVFDVETIGCRWEDLAGEEREYLTRRFDSESVNTEQRARGRLALSPLTGEIVCIGLLNPDTSRGRIYVRSKDAPPDSYHMRSHDALTRAASTDGSRIEVWPCADEEHLLRAFWSALAHYEQVISFNGRGFDGPFVMTRSLACRVPVGKNLVPNRYYDDHIDLADRLTAYGAMRERYTLDFWCRRLGIPSPKADGMTGADAERLWRSGDLAALCRYNAGDLRATATLFARYALTYGAIQRVPLVPDPDAQAETVPHSFDRAPNEPLPP